MPLKHYHPLYRAFLGALTLTLFCCLSQGAAQAQFYNNNQANNSRDLTVFYATSRLDQTPGGRPTYGGTRHLDLGSGSLDYGALAFARPSGQAAAAAPDWPRLRSVMAARDLYWKQAPVKDIARLSNSEIEARIRNFRGLIVIYVHGYGMSFEDTARELGELVDEYKSRAQNSQRQILPIVFSWPSPGKAADYTGDEANLEWSEAPFRAFIDRLAILKNPDCDIDLIGHSMGSRYAFAYGVAHRDNTSMQPVFRNVVLSCADMDYHTAEQKKGDLERMVANTLYVLTNDADNALLTSQALHAQPRLGRPSDNGTAVRQSPAALLGTGTGGLSTAKDRLLKDGKLFSTGDTRKIFNELKGVAGTFMKADINAAPLQTAVVNSWLSVNPALSREWGAKSRLVDTTGLVTINMGHRLAWPLVAGLLMEEPTMRPFTVTSIHKRPDALTLSQMGGSPRYLYRWDRVDLTRLAD